MTRKETKRIKKSLGAFRLSEPYGLEKYIGIKQGCLRQYMILFLDLAARFNVGKMKKDSDTILSFVDTFVTQFRSDYIRELREDKFHSFLWFHAKSTKRYDTQRQLIALRMFRERMQSNYLMELENQEQKAEINS